MTEVQAHIAHVAAAPFEKVPALALVDHLQEAFGYSRWTALRKVAAVRKPGRDVEYAARAARLMRARTMAKFELDSLIEDEAGLHSYDLYQVLLIRGYAPPKLHPDFGPENPVYDVEAIVFVGARWVISSYRHLVRNARYRIKAYRQQRREQ